MAKYRYMSPLSSPRSGIWSKLWTPGPGTFEFLARRNGNEIAWWPYLKPSSRFHSWISHYTVFNMICVNWSMFWHTVISFLFLVLIPWNHEWWNQSLSCLMIFVRTSRIFCRYICFNFTLRIKCEWPIGRRHLGPVREKITTLLQVTSLVHLFCITSRLKITSIGTSKFWKPQ